MFGWNSTNLKSAGLASFSSLLVYLTAVRIRTFQHRPRIVDGSPLNKKINPTLKGRTRRFLDEAHHKDIS